MSIMKQVLQRISAAIAGCIVRVWYRCSVDNVSGIPARGPAVLVMNHVSFLDPILVSAMCRRPIRFFMERQEFDRSSLRAVLAACGVRSIDSAPQGGLALAEVSQELSRGGIVGVFPEGAITRTGFLNAFDSRYLGVAESAGCPVIPVYIDFGRGSRTAVMGPGTIVLKNGIRRSVTIVCGSPHPASSGAREIRRAVEEQSARAWELRTARRRSLGFMMIRRARRNWLRPALCDTTGKRVTFGKALIGSLALSEVVGREFGEERMIGVLLPASVGGSLVNVGITLAGKMPVNLNFTTASENIAHAARTCGIKSVVTSKQFLAKMPNLATPGRTVFVEDILRAVGRGERVKALLKALFVPARILTRERTIDPNSCATVVFSSGSTANPKGIVLSHHNIASNIEQMCAVFDLSRDDCLCGVLPFFHSFGLTATLWFPLLAGFRAAYHPNPLDGATVASVVRDERATILLCTPTFLQGYVRKAKREDLATLRLVISGAEKLKPALAAAFFEKYGVTPVEGYGATELSPVACLNVPDITLWGRKEEGCRAGTIGRILPGMCTRIVDPDTAAVVEDGRPGLMFLKGPNVMKGYLNQPAETEAVVKDGWYATGDIASIGDDGFVTLTDRLARFSKIAGEMVPHGALEEILVSGLDTPEPAVAVTAVPDANRGERIVVLYTSEAGPAERLHAIMQAAGVPNLWKPAADAYLAIEKIPVLGTGKTDLKAIRARAAEAFASPIAG